MRPLRSSCSDCHILFFAWHRPPPSPFAHLICHKNCFVSSITVHLLLYCNGRPLPCGCKSGSTGWPSLVRHAYTKLCFPNRLPAASDSCQACSMLSSTDTRLAQPCVHGCPASDGSFHYHGNDSTVFNPVTRFRG